jgi:hypothetical protein
MRSVYRLLGLVRRYGSGPVEAACRRSLDLDVVNVSKIAAMLAKATEQHQPMLPGAAGSTMRHTQGGRFARDPGEYAPQATTRGVHLTVIPGGLADPADQHRGDRR